MTQASSRLKPVRLIVSLLVVFAVSLCLWLVFPGLYRAEPPLDPYFTVLTPLDHAAAADALRAAGVTELITPASTSVLVTRYHSLEAVPLPVALERLDPLDPRRDPWITALGGYFGAGELNTIYARLDLPPGRASRVVRRVLGGGSRVAEWSPWRSLAGLVLFLAVSVAVALVFGRGGLVLVPMAFPWVPAVVSVGLPAGVAASALIVSFAWVASELSRDLSARLSSSARKPGTRRPDALFYRAIVSAAVLLAALVYVVRLSGLAASLSLVVAAIGCGAGAGTWLLLRRTRRDPDHQPFEPVLILSGRNRTPGERRWKRLALLVLPALALLPPVADALLPGGDALRPVPSGAAYEGLDHGSIQALWQAREGGAHEDANRAAEGVTPAQRSGSMLRLPDISDYLAHRAYQEALMYGRSYGFPAPGETVELLRFREETDGSYSSFQEPVLVFDEEWVRRVLNEAPSGIARMLVSLGRATGVVLAANHALYSAYSRLVQHLAFVVLVMAPFLFSAVPWPRSAGARDSVLDLGRRRKQVA